MNSVQVDWSFYLALISILATFSVGIFFWILNPGKARLWLRKTFVFFRLKHPSYVVVPEFKSLKGMVEVLSPEIFNKAADERTLRNYYEEALLNWDVIVSHADIGRDQQAEFMDLCHPAPQSLRFVIITGEPGAGKSTLARRIAYDLYQRHRAVVVRVKEPGGNPELWHHIASICHDCKRHVYVLADDIFLVPEVKIALSDLDHDLPMTIIGTSQSHEDYKFHPNGEVKRKNLNQPSSNEKSDVLKRLGLEETKLTPEQCKRMEQANEFVVLMAELSTGEGYRKIIDNSLTQLKSNHPEIYQAYEYLCFSFSLGVSIPSTLIDNLHPKGNFHNLAERPGARGLIRYVENNNGLLYPGHQVRARTAREIYEEVRASSMVLQELINAVDPADYSQRRYAAFLLRKLAITDDPSLSQAMPSIQGKVQAIRDAADRINELSIWHAYFEKLKLGTAKGRCVSDILTKEIQSDDECKLLLSLSRGANRHREALPMIERWINRSPESGPGRLVQLELVQKFGSYSQKISVFDSSRTWLSSHPKDKQVRNTLISFAKFLPTNEKMLQFFKETEKWLEEHTSAQEVMEGFLGLVNEKGSPDYAKRIINETENVLSDELKESSVKTGYLSLVANQGTDKQVESAIRKTTRWLMKNKDNTHVRTIFLLLVEKRGSRKRVAITLRETELWLRDHPQADEVWPRYIAMLAASGEYDAAKKSLSEAMEKNPQNVTIGTKYFQEMQPYFNETQMRELYSSLISLSPKHIVLKNLMGKWLSSQGHITEAENLFQELIRKHPKFFIARLNYGRMLQSQNRDQEAMDQFVHVLRQTNKRNSAAHDGLAMGYRKLAISFKEQGKDYDAERCFIYAEESYRSAIFYAGADSHQDLYIRHLGQLYETLGRYDEAIKTLQDAIDYSPDFHKNYLERGRVFMKMKKWDEALADLRTARTKMGSNLRNEPDLAEIVELIELCEQGRI